MKRLGFKEALFILPAIILIAVFSLWPIFKVINYSVFDYRLNDQQKSNLYTAQRFNAGLFNENADYITMFLDEDRASFPKEALGEVDTVKSDTKELQKLLSGKSGIIQLNGDLKTKIQSYSKEITDKSNELISKYDFSEKNNLKLIIEDLNKCYIDSNFIGLKGYKNALSDPRIKTDLRNTCLFTFFSVFFEFILGLGLAIIMNKAIKGRGLIRTASLIPWAIPTAVAALMWNYLYDGSSGIVAHIFQMLHIVKDSKDLLLTSSGAMASSIIADVWKTTPYMALLILAGFQTIPGSLYESAEVDGANKITTFFKITLPLLKPSILVALLFRTLDAFRVFDLIYVLTGGGPGGSTETLSIYAYKLMFEQTNFGYGSIVVLLMFLCVAAIATIYVKVLGTNLMERD